MCKINDEAVSVLVGQDEPAPGTGARLPATDDPVAAALEFLATTAPKVHPDLSVKRMLFYAERARAHLATVLAAIESGDVLVHVSNTPTG